MDLPGLLRLCCNTLGSRITLSNMESGAAFFILVGAFLLIGVPVLAIAAFVRAGNLKKQVEAETPQLIARIYALERQLDADRKGPRDAEQCTGRTRGSAGSRRNTCARRSRRNCRLRPARESYRRWMFRERPRHRLCRPLRHRKKLRPFGELPALSMPSSAAACRVEATAGISKRWSPGAG